MAVTSGVLKVKFYDCLPGLAPPLDQGLIFLTLRDQLKVSLQAIGVVRGAPIDDNNMALLYMDVHRQWDPAEDGEMLWLDRGSAARNMLLVAARPRGGVWTTTTKADRDWPELVAWVTARPVIEEVKP